MREWYWSRHAVLVGVVGMVLGWQRGGWAEEVPDVEAVIEGIRSAQEVWRRLPVRLRYESTYESHWLPEDRLPPKVDPNTGWLVARGQLWLEHSAKFAHQTRSVVRFVQVPGVGILWDDYSEFEEPVELEPLRFEIKRHRNIYLHTRERYKNWTGFLHDPEVLPQQAYRLGNTGPAKPESKWPLFWPQGYAYVLGWDGKYVFELLELYRKESELPDFVEEHKEAPRVVAVENIDGRKALVVQYETRDRSVRRADGRKFEFVGGMVWRTWFLPLDGWAVARSEYVSWDESVATKKRIIKSRHVAEVKRWREVVPGVIIPALLTVVQEDYAPQADKLLPMVSVRVELKEFSYGDTRAEELAYEWPPHTLVYELDEAGELVDEYTVPAPVVVRDMSGSEGRWWYWAAAGLGAVVTALLATVMWLRRRTVGSGLS